LEFGHSRDQDLALRDDIRPSQPQMRAFAHADRRVKYRAQLPSCELLSPISARWREFDDQLARSLEALAERIEGHSTGVQQTLEIALTQLEPPIKNYGTAGVADVHPPSIACASPQ
jgi:hypothetical protein